MCTVGRLYGHPPTTSPNNLPTVDTVPDNIHQLHVQTTFLLCLTSTNYMSKQPSYCAWQRPPTTCPNNLPRMKSQSSFRLLMLGGVSPETCWASNKYEIIKFWYIVASCWIFLYELMLCSLLPRWLQQQLIKTTGTTKLQINYNELKIINYFMLRISYYPHNTYQSTPWGAENNYSKVSNIQGCSLPACTERKILYLVQWVFKSEEKSASLE